MIITFGDAAAFIASSGQYKLNFKQSEKLKNKLTTHISKKANGPINIKDLLKHFN